MALEVYVNAQTWLLAIYAAPFIGSFVGLVIDRLPAGRPVVLARSTCDQCGTRLGWPDLVPLASWLLAGGRCRHCGGAVSPFYPLIELAALALASWSAVLFDGWLLAWSCLLGFPLLALAVIDRRHLLLPDPLTLGLLLAGLIEAAMLAPADLADRAIGAAAGFIAFATLAAAYRRLRRRDGLGLGDAKLLAAAGAWVSWQGLPSVVLAATASALVLLGGQALAGRAPAPDRPIPFGPHLCLGLWLVWSWGPLFGGAAP